MSLKLEKACRANKEMEFSTLCKQFLKICRGSKILKTAGGKTVNEPYILCKIFIRSQEQCLAYRSNFFRSIFYKALSIYSASILIILNIKDLVLVPRHNVSDGKATSSGACHGQTRSLPSNSPGTEGEAGRLRAGKSCLRRIWRWPDLHR